MIATCRFCGAQGNESADDVAPGVCPACLASRMEAADAEAKRRAPLTTAQAVALLREVGLTDEAARDVVGEVRK